MILKYNFLFFIFFLTYNHAICQNNDGKTCYKAFGIYVDAKDSEGNIKSTIPLGKDVVIYFDHFYKSYHLMYKFQDGLTEMKLNYIKSLDEEIVKMIDDLKEMYYVADSLAVDGSLIMIKEEEISGLYAVLRINNAVLCKN